jgi:Ni,Fe-hydrogenase I large subunit
VVAVSLCLACAVHIHDEHGTTVHRLETF